MKDNVLWQLLVVFAPLSMLSIGGGQSVMADVQQQVVVTHHWLTIGQFLDDYAIARACPGPGSLVVTLIGWQVGGIAGSVLASLAVFVPSSLLFYGFALVWRRHSAHPWTEKLARGLAPVSVGLIFASTYSVLAASDSGVVGWLITAASLLLLMKTQVHPALLLAAGACITPICARHAS